MNLEKTLSKFQKDKRVSYPFTVEKIEKRGYKTSEFLKELVEKMKNADDFNTIENKTKRKLDALIKTCEALND